MSIYSFRYFIFTFVSTKKGGAHTFKIRTNTGASVPLNAVFSTERMPLHGTDARHGHALALLQRDKSMKRLIQIVLIVVVVLGVASMAGAQARPPEAPGGEPRPVVRLGNYIEVGNDVWMQILGLADLRYQTVNNFDFEGRVRDRVPSRNPLDTREQSGDYKGIWRIIRVGTDFRYQKNLSMELQVEERPNVDQSIDRSRFNSTNPGGTDIFGRGPVSENNGPAFIDAWIDYKFEGTPLRMRAGWDLSSVDQAGL